MIAPNETMPSISFRTVGVLMLLGLSLSVIGCGPQLVPVQGVVTLDGDPVPNAAVTFTRQESGETANGMTNAQGEFTLKTSKLGKGALPGEHVVVVSAVKYEGVGETEDGVESGGGKITEKWITPQRYANPKTSGLTETVSSGMEPIAIELKSE